MIGAMASHVPADAPAHVSPGGAAWGIELPVPPYSQQLHRGEYLHWDRGGRSWCSPTSMSMLLAYHDRLPEPGDYAWVQPDYPNPFVVQAARHVYDYAYKGAGNWSFNTAYAGRHGAEAFVTRLRSLTEAEAFIAAGVPLAATVSFSESGLAGAGYATEGHLLTIVGFTADGDVICNDPASHTIPSNDEVRVVFDRDAVRARVWLGLVRAASSTSCTPRTYPSLLPRTPPNPTGDRPAALAELRARWWPPRGRRRRTRCASRWRRRAPRRLRRRSGCSRRSRWRGPRAGALPRCVRRRSGPLHPGVGRRGPGQLGPPCHAPRRAGTSTLSMPVCCAQATPPTRHRPGLHVRWSRGTSTRDCGLHRPPVGPAAVGPVGR